MPSGAMLGEQVPWSAEARGQHHGQVQGLQQGPLFSR